MGRDKPARQRLAQRAGRWRAGALRGAGGVRLDSDTPSAVVRARGAGPAQGVAPIFQAIWRLSGPAQVSIALRGGRREEIIARRRPPDRATKIRTV